jgi:hypothetical protein
MNKSYAQGLWVKDNSYDQANDQIEKSMDRQRD